MVQDTLEYNNISEETLGYMYSGTFKFKNNAILFKNNKTGKIDQIFCTDISIASWIQLSIGLGLRIKTNNGNFRRFGGFSEQDKDKIAKFCESNYSLNIGEVKYSVKGHNWGNPHFDGSMLSLELPNKSGDINETALEIPLNYVSRCTSGKNEIALEFHQNDDAPVSLVEIRFHIPSSETDPDPVKTFHERVMEKANVIQVVGDAIAIFTEAQCLTPRGRYDIKLYPTFAQLHGKSFDYKIPYSTILRLFVLPHKDHRQIYFVISLDPPIKQGQTRYPFLILLFEKDEEITMKLSLNEKQIKENYEGKLSQEMSGKTFEIFSRLIKALSGNKITVPGNFKSHNGSSSCISCSYKAAAGYLYPLERCFVFVHKPPLAIRFDEVASVNFARSSGMTTKTFDFEIATKSGTDHVFSNIAKEEYSSLYDFIKTKNLIVRNVGGKLSSSDKVAQENDFDDDDEPDDPYLNRVKAEADQEDEESQDEDFAPTEDNEDVDEEYDSNAQSSSAESVTSHVSDSRSKSKTPNKDKKTHKKSSIPDSHKKIKTMERTVNDNVLEDSDEEKDVKVELPKATPNPTKKDSTKKSSTSGGAASSKKNKEKTTSKKKKTNKDKDPDLPKRPLSTYFMWLQENRERLKRENPKASIIEITKIGGEAWRNITDKSRWEKLSLKAKDEYIIAMKNYQAKKANLSSKTTDNVQTKSKSKSDDDGDKSSDLSSLDD
ncbi:unnamed protein product [Gordionus sp. m RMFG-2023]|uniref:FACT complex subunit Ssrp1-like isoform X2 n=1 Tax=Gordionus sp. m RMFG-2023 TaxID=3053472 RepID=UPI0030E04352